MSGPLARINIGLLHPLVQRRARADLGRHRHDRRSPISGKDVHVRDQTPVARRASALPGKLVRRLAHDGPTFSGVGVTGKPGAVQLQERRAKLVGGMAVARR